MIITHYLYIRPSSLVPHSLCRQFLWYTKKNCQHQSQTLECTLELNPRRTTTKLEIMECGIRQWQQKIIKSITALPFCKLEHPAVAQHDFSWRHQSSHNPSLYSASYWNVAVTNPARRGENNHHWQMTPRTDTNQCHRHVTHDMAKGIQISRVTSANTTHSTKISAVNHKQLSSNIIDPIFYGTYGLAVSKQSHSGKRIQIWVLEALWHPKNQFWDFISSQKWYIYMLPFHLHS
jgi:hypothetical protein